MKLGDLLTDRIPSDVTRVREVVAGLDALIARGEQYRGALDWGAAETHRKATPRESEVHSEAVDLRDQVAEGLESARRKRAMIVAFGERLEAAHAKAAPERERLNEADVDLWPLPIPPGEPARSWWEWTQITHLIQAVSAAAPTPSKSGLVDLDTIDAIHLGLTLWRRTQNPADVFVPPAVGSAAPGADAEAVREVSTRMLTSVSATPNALAASRVWIAAGVTAVGRDGGLGAASVDEASAGLREALVGNEASQPFGRTCHLADADLAESLLSPNPIVRANTARSLSEALPMLGAEGIKTALDQGNWQASCLSVAWFDAAPTGGIIDGAALLILRGGHELCLVQPGPGGVSVTGLKATSVDDLIAGWIGQ